MREVMPAVRGLEYRLLAGLSLFLGLALLALVLHELGHYLAARWQGCRVLSVHLGPVDLRPQRGRWQFRWVGSASWLSGAVMALPRMDKPFRTQMLWYVSGGSLAGLLVGALAAWAGWAGGDADWAGVLTGFGVINVLIGAANLLPLGPMTDGTQLVRLLKGMDLGQPGMEAIELNMRAMEGQTADEMPEHLMEGLERESPPMALWFRTFAALNRQDWDAVQAQSDCLDAWEASLGRSSRPAWAVFIGVLRGEMRFVRGLQGAGFVPEKDDALRREICRLRPGVEDRHLALVHALAGDTVKRDNALERAERESEFNPDPASRKTEQRLRNLVRNLPIAERAA
ncbi:M50 family metallopeptidase [Arenimonas donghaensis]|nr:M50 family metallopeptidase [Arenimonas donghaensis]